jgi:hypothetical protein
MSANVSDTGRAARSDSRDHMMASVWMTRRQAYRLAIN